MTAVATLGAVVLTLLAAVVTTAAMAEEMVAVTRLVACKYLHSLPREAHACRILTFTKLQSDRPLCP